MKISRKDFFNEAYTSARAAGLNDTQARLAASQAALETGYGKSVVGNNYFGIKAGKSWGGPAVTAGTWEDTGKGAVRERARFRAYDNPAKSFSDWASTVSKRWGDAFNAPTLEQAISGLRYGKPGGYATDRNYGAKLRAINAKYGPQADQVDGIMSAVNPAQTVVPTAKPVQSAGLVDPMQQLQRNREIGLLGMEATNSQPMRDMRFALETQKTGLLPRQELKPLDSPEPGLLASSISRNPFDTMQTVPQGVEKVARVDPSLVGFEQDVAKQSAWNRAGAALREQRGILQDAGPISGLLSQQVTPVGYDQRFAGPVRQVQSPVETAYQPTAEVTGPASMAGMVKDPVSTPGLMSNEERAMVDRQRGLLANQPLNSNTGARLLSGAKGLAGGFGGALLGGALLGPVGGLLGGLVGRQMTTGGLLNRFPDAPKGKTQGDGKETDYGRDVRQSSKQYDRAVSRGGIGLY